MVKNNIFHQYWHRLIWLLVYSQTAAARFWFGLVSIGTCTFMFTSFYFYQKDSPYHIMMQLAPGWFWGWGYLLHGVAMWYGVFTRKYNIVLLFLEGVLGVTLWVAMAAAIYIGQGSLGGTAAGSAIALWLLVRYPTHHEYDNFDACDGC